MERQRKRRRANVPASRVYVTRAPDTRRSYRTRQMRGAAARIAVQGAELKLKNVSIDTTPLTTAGTLTLLNGMVQGDDVAERVGRRFKMVSIWTKMDYHIAETESDETPVTVREIIFIDFQANGAAPAVTDVLDSADIHAFTNASNKQRFKILSDVRKFLGFWEVSATPAYGNSGCPPFQVSIDHYRRLDTEVCNLNANGDVSGISSGSLYMLQIANAATVAESHGAARLRFAD